MSTGANVTLALAVATGGAIVAWAGFADPPGGLPGALQRIMNGQPAAPARQASDPLDLTSVLYAGGTSGTDGSGGTATPASMTAGGQPWIVTEARKFIGDRYVYGAAGPSTFDCSGLVQYVFKQLHVSMPRIAAAQQLKGTGIAASAVQPGDLVCFGHPAFHIGIVSTPGKMIVAPSTGKLVQEQSYSWGTPFGLSFRRVAVPNPAGSSSATTGLVYV